MSISATGKWIVAFAAAIGVIIGTIKSVADVAKNLNGWQVLFALSFLVLCGLGIDAGLQSINKKLAGLKQSINELSPKETPLQPLRARVLALSDELRAWRIRLGQQPKESYRSDMSSTEFADEYARTVMPWQMKYFHGFHLQFAERVAQLSHELGILGIGDNALDDAFGRMFRGVDKTDDKDVDVIANALARLVTELPPD